MPSSRRTTSNSSAAGSSLGMDSSSTWSGRNRSTPGSAAIDGLIATPGIAAAVITREQIVDKSLMAAVAEAFSSLADRGQRPVVIVSGIDELIADDPQVLTRLNQQRSQLIAGSPGALVIVMTPTSVAAFRRAAPDTWSVRSADIDVDWLAPAPPRDLDATHQLQMIRPPGSRRERRILELQLERYPPGIERGRAALRLAEIYRFEGRSDRSIASLYLRAAAEIQDPWMKCLAFANACRAFVRVPDREGAADSLERALQASQSLDTGLQAYVIQSEAAYLLTFDEPKAALQSLERAVKEAWKSGDHDLLAELRLQRAETYRRLSQLQKALSEARAGEEEASRTGSDRLLDRARRLVGILSIELGRPQEARSAWLRFPGAIP